MDAPGKLGRCCLCLSDFEFNVVLGADIKHQSADALSRLPTDGENTTDLNVALPAFTIVPADKAKEARAEGTDE